MLQRDVLKETVNESRDRSGDREDRDVSRGEHKLARDHLERVALEGASFIAYLVKYNARKRSVPCLYCLLALDVPSYY